MWEHGDSAPGKGMLRVEARQCVEKESLLWLELSEHEREEKERRAEDSGFRTAGHCRDSLLSLSEQEASMGLEQKRQAFSSI
jgi:hypothetical protein